MSSFFLCTLSPWGRSETKRAAFGAPLRHLAFLCRNTGLFKQQPPAGRTRLLTHAGRSPNIVSDQEREGPQIKMLSIVARRNVIPDCSQSSTHVDCGEPRRQPGKNVSLPFVEKAAVLSSSMRRRSTCQQRGGNRDGALSLRGLLKGRLCKGSNKEKKEAIFEVVGSSVVSVCVTWHFFCGLFKSIQPSFDKVFTFNTSAVWT